jgi:hypothetical protein
MQIDMDKEVAPHQRMTVGQLREKFEKTWGEPTNARNNQWLVKRIAWKMQANIESDISPRLCVALRNSLTVPTSVHPPPMSASRY